MRKCLISVNVALLLSFSLFHFPLSGYLWVLECVCEFSLADDRRSAVDLLLLCLLSALSACWASQTKDSICICKHEWINWWYELSIVLLTDITSRAVSLLQDCLPWERNHPPLTFFLCVCVCAHIASKCAGKTFCYQSAITKGMEMCHKPTWWGTSSPLRNLEKCEELDICQLPRLAQPGSTQAHLVNSANYANQKPNDDDEGV